MGTGMNNAQGHTMDCLGAAQARAGGVPRPTRGEATPPPRTRAMPSPWRGKSVTWHGHDKPCAGLQGGRGGLLCSELEKRYKNATRQQGVACPEQAMGRGRLWTRTTDLPAHPPTNNRSDKRKQLAHATSLANAAQASEAMLQSTRPIVYAAQQRAAETHNCRVAAGRRRTNCSEDRPTSCRRSMALGTSPQHTPTHNDACTASMQPAAVDTRTPVTMHPGR